MIPRIIHQIWIGDPYPPYIEKCMLLWRAHHPTWRFEFWTEVELSAFDMVNRELYETAEHYCLPGRLEQFRADIARYEILHEFGGVYVDADFECLRPIDDLPQDGAWLPWEKDGTWLSNGIIGAEPGHPFIGEIREALTPHALGMVRREGPVATARLSGPQFITKLWRQRERFDVTTLPERLFFPYSWNELDEHERPAAPDAYARHHWHNQRRIRGKALP